MQALCLIDQKSVAIAEKRKKHSFLLVTIFVTFFTVDEFASLIPTILPPLMIHARKIPTPNLLYCHSYPIPFRGLFFYLFFFNFFFLLYILTSISLNFSNGIGALILHSKLRSGKKNYIKKQRSDFIEGGIKGLKFSISIPGISHDTKRCINGHDEYFSLLFIQCCLCCPIIVLLVLCFRNSVLYLNVC